MPYKDSTRQKIRRADYYQQNKEEIKEKNADLYQRNKEYIKEKSSIYYQENKEEKKSYNKKRFQNIQNCAISSIENGEIENLHIWHLYCNQKRQHAKKYPYSKDFTDEIFFEKMKDGCVYCGDIADTIDRLDSNLDHTPDNCVGSCLPCNNSKGNGDPDSFLRKAYYRSRREYFDNIENIWSDSIRKPRLYEAKAKSQKQKRDFTLTVESWNVLVNGDCVYCKRSKPEGKWNGVDRVIPSDGYTLENVVSCCHDCNVDKLWWSVEEMRKRNDNIAERLDNRKITLFDCSKVLRNKGTNQTSKKVCVYGKVYASKIEASIAIGKCDNYILTYIGNNWQPSDIFEISENFYEFAIKSKLENITKEMFNAFQTM